MGMDTKIDEFVNVAVRIRPLLSQDSTASSCLQVISKQPSVLLVVDRSQTYHFDNIFTEEVNQEFVYNETVKPLVAYVKHGYNCTVFAYGQTGTGKTYTMGTCSQTETQEDAGLIPRALEEFFTYYDDNIETEISVSFMEIYNEKVFDLLQNNNLPLAVKGFRVQGCSQEVVVNCKEAKHFLEIGNKNRHTSGTKQNSNSSRSHAIFTIHCNVRHEQYETTAKLNLVDLAGCESVKKTGNQGSTFHEGVNINKGLLCIGQVMTALSTNSNFIPYRQSIITTILQDSLNKKNFVSLIACVNGNPEDCNETVQTLEFAQRVKKMKNKPEVNEVIMQYKRENPLLFQPIKINTPFKRPGSIFQTPNMTKRVKTIPLKTVNEVSGNSTALDSPKSLSSISVTSVSSTIDISQQTFSPVIKKYMTAMESSLVDRIEILIKDTLKRPTRSSLLLKENKEKNKENTPSMSWDKIQNEVSKLVRTEIAQLTSKTARAASSPIDEHTSFNKIRKVLTYESPVLNESTDKGNENNINTSKDSCQEETVFKVPELPNIKRKAVEIKHTPSISPIEFVPRRSTRLSLKRINCNNTKSPENYNCFCNVSIGNTSNLNMSTFEKRDSIRLANNKGNIRSNQIETSMEKDKLISNNNSLDDFDLEATGKIINMSQNSKRLSKNNKLTQKSNYSNRRTSIRLNKKSADQAKDVTIIQSKLTVKATPIGRKVMKYKTSTDSPATAHTKYVLTSLNHGNAKQLENLHSIGPKTAQQIMLFREIKGPLMKISDLSSMPGWQGKKFKTFVEQNFIKDQLL